MFVKGQSGNMKGRPKGSVSGYSIANLMKAIVKVEKRDKTNLLEHFVEKAFFDDKVLIALMRKVLPDMIYKDMGDADERFAQEIRIINVNGGNGNGEKTKTAVEQYKRFLA